MKETILFLMIISSTAIQSVTAQVDYCKCAENSLDPVSGQRIVQSKFYTVGRNQKTNSALLVSVRRIDSLYYLYIESQLLQDCTGPGTVVAFTTTAGEVIKKNHIGDVDCGETSIYSTRTPTVIKILVEEEMIRKGGLTKIRLSSKEHYEDIKIQMPFNLRTVFDCVDETFAKETKRKPKKGLENTPPPE